MNHNNPTTTNTPHNNSTTNASNVNAPVNTFITSNLGSTFKTPDPIMAGYNSNPSTAGGSVTVPAPAGIASTTHSTRNMSTPASAACPPLAHISLSVPNPVSSPPSEPISTLGEVPPTTRAASVVTTSSTAVGGLRHNGESVMPPSQSSSVPTTAGTSTNNMYNRTPTLAIPATTNTTTTATASNTITNTTIQNNPSNNSNSNSNNISATPIASTTTSILHSASMVSRPSAKPPSKKKKNSISMNTAQSVSSSGSVQGENTGRWTAEEHRLFLQGLEQHGKGWKKIASLIKSRTVVQIRTHAQKYFQKIAKARQNGDDGEVSMENRENAVLSTSAKKKKSGTKRKAIASVVASAAVEAKKQATDKAKCMMGADPVIPLSFVAPALTPFVHVSNLGTAELTEGQVTPTESTVSHTSTGVPSFTSSHGTVSGAALEDSLFRFLTPMPNDSQVNVIARQAGANPITVPSESAKTNHAQYDEGEISPTGVVDFPSDWAWSEDPPSWYTKGADVDELLNEADALDWLADSGDLNETYIPPPDHSKMSEPSLMSLVDADDIKVEKGFPTADTVPIPVLESGTGLPTSSSSGNMPPFTSMFGSVNNLSNMKKGPSVNLSSVSLFASASEAVDAVVDVENFKLLDEHFDEQAFVTALLDQSSDSAHNLSHLEH